MNRRLGKILKYILSLSIAAALLYFCFRGVAWSDFVGGLKQCNWPFILLSMLCGIGAFSLKGLRWHNLLQPVAPNIRRFDAYDGVTIGNVANMIFPFLGDFARSGIITKNTKARYDKTLGTVELERVWDVIFVFLLLAALLAAKWGDFGDFFADKIWEPMRSRFDWLVWLALGVLLLVVALAAWALIKYHSRSRFLDKIYQPIAGLCSGFVSVLKMKKKLLFVGETALLWTMYWLQIVFVIQAFPPAGGMGLVDALLIMLAGSIATLIPVPGGFGAYHYVVALALSTIYGFPWESGIVFATIAHESQAVTMLLTGSVSYIHQLLKRKHNDNQR